MTSYQASHVTNFMRANAIATLSPRAPRNLSCAYCMPPARELTRIESTFLNRSQVSFITSGNMHSGPLMYFARARNGLPPNQHSLAASMAVKIARSKRPARGIHTTSRRGSCKTCYNRMFERGVGNVPQRQASVGGEGIRKAWWVFLIESAQVMFKGACTLITVLAFVDFLSMAALSNSCPLVLCVGLAPRASRLAAITTAAVPLSLRTVCVGQNSLGLRSREVSSS